MLLMEYPLELLEDMHIVKRDFIQSARKGRPLENIKISPFAF